MTSPDIADIRRSIADLYIDDAGTIADDLPGLIHEAQGLVAILSDAAEGARDHRGDLDPEAVISLLRSLDRNLSAARLMASHIRNGGAAR
jgi:hypothetical protein